MNPPNSIFFKLKDCEFVCLLQLYKGRVRDGSVVLVKSLKLKQKHLSQSLMQHMDVLSKLRHRHLVSILGHCIVTYQDHPNTASTVFIVHEHVSNGSLRDYLNGKVNSTNDGLSEILLHKLHKLMS